MKFSVIVPSLYERPQWWDDCINSVRKQEHEDWELLLSTDADVPVPDDPRIKIVRGQNHSMARALNLAMKAATGDVFSWLCDDDMLLPGALNVINENIGDAMWCHAQMLYHNAPYGSFNLWSLLNVGNSMPILSVYWTRKAYEIVGGFDESLVADCDYEYWLRLAMRWVPKPVEKITAYYRHHPGMATHVLGREMVAEAERIRAQYATLT